MSDEVSDRTDSAVRSYIGTVAFCCVLLGAELLSEKEGSRSWLGLSLIALGLPLYLSAVIWKAIKDKISGRARISLNSVASDARWWLGILLVILVSFAISPFFGERWTAVTYNIVILAALLAAAIAIASV